MTEPTPTNPAPPPQHAERVRRRRAQRMLYPSDAEGQAAVLADLSARSFPTFELFIYALLSGAILAAGYLLDSQAVLIFGILAAPLLTSWVGLSIATVTGSPRFFAQTLAALLVSRGWWAADAPTAAKMPAQRIGRNETCPCGSGRKFKHCHDRPVPLLFDATR